jgi:MFS family permease
VGLHAWQPYFLELLGSDAVWMAGVVAALTALATIAGNALVEFFGRFCAGPRRTTLLIAVSMVMVAATVGVGLVDSFWLAAALLLVAAAEGVGTPVQQAHHHHVIPSSERATVISSVSLVANIGGIGGQLGLGYLSRAQSVVAGTGGLVIVLAVPPLLLRQCMSEHADVIGGRRAGEWGPCAAQGLPHVASVDTTARQPAVSTR